MTSIVQEPASAWRDLRFQADYIIDASWRLMAMQDGHPLSPTRGSFHYAYWRDKTSEFPDARFQEAGATLGLLSLPAFDAERTAGRLASSANLYGAFADALANWERLQYPEGSFDEWYKGERGFAATEFTTIAFCLAARLLGDRLYSDDRTRLVRVVGAAASWLAERDDRIKANHQAAAAAALALAYDVTGEKTLLGAAQRKLDDTLARQHPEGWFPEVGGMDLGYCSVLLDYVMIYSLVTGDNRAVPAMRRLFDFMLPLIHPDGTISAEMGLCLNPYVSRLGLGLLSAHHPPCAILMSYFVNHTPGRDALRPYLADDLRLARWSHLPLVTMLLGDRFAAPEKPNGFLHLVPRGWTMAEEAGVCAYHDDDLHVYCSAAGGGTVRVYRADALIYEDSAPWLENPNAAYCVAGYAPARLADRRSDGFGLRTRLGEARFVFPGWLPRLVLRAGATTAIGSRLLRTAIDALRLRRHTAVNQSAAPVANENSPYVLERNVSVAGRVVQIVDRLFSDGPLIDSTTLVSSITLHSTPQRLPIAGEQSRGFVIAKSLDFGSSPQVGFHWTVTREGKCFSGESKLPVSTATAP
jgi:hypothetical protein